MKVKEIDYSDRYPNMKPEILSKDSYTRKWCSTYVKGKDITTVSLSRYHRALEIDSILKNWILSGK